MHADLVALYPLPYALRILPDTAISAGMHATCTPACMPARQAMHTHLRATYILLIFIVVSIRHAIIQVEMMFVKYKLLLLLNHHKHYECTSNDLKRAFTTCSDEKYQTTYSH